MILVRIYFKVTKKYMQFVEAIFSFAEAICSKIENNNHLSPVDTEAGTELGNMKYWSLVNKLSLQPAKSNIL